MKLRVAFVFSAVLMSSASIGCGPGLSHHLRAQTPNDTSSTTTLTSEAMVLPESRMPVAQWNEADEAPAAPAAKTWGVPATPAPAPGDAL